MFAQPFRNPERCVNAIESLLGSLDPSLFRRILGAQQEESMKTELFILDDPKGEHKWWSIYFHGEAESLANSEWNNEERFCAYDLVSGSVDPYSLGQGIHEVTVYGKEATAYLWSIGGPGTAQITGRNSRGEIVLRHKKLPYLMKGLVVLKDDLEAQGFALAKYNSRAECL